LKVQNQPKQQENRFNYSNLYVDFLNGDEKIRKFLPEASPVRVAPQVVDTPFDRDVLCEILNRQNEHYKAGEKTFEAIEQLRRSNAVCVFTGQQVGMYGGPLFTLYKAAGIVRKAEELQKELNRPVVPVFWLAADDHDFEEINHFHYFEKDGSAGKMIYKAAPSDGLPVSEISFNDSELYAEFVEKTKEVFGESDFTERMYERLFRAYAPDSSMVDAFARYFFSIFPDSGLIMFSPADTEVKKRSRRFFQRIVEQYFNLKTLLEQTDTLLEMDGYHIQAEKKLTAVHLFYHDPERKPIHFADNSFLVGEKMIGQPGLLDLIERNPEKFSPDVLTRPIWQSYLFPVVAHAGGPSEIAYFCQISQLFKPFKLTQPYCFARPTATLVEKHHEELMEKHHLSLEDLTGDVELLINRLLGGYFPEDTEEKLNQLRRKLNGDYKEMARLIIDFDVALKPMTEQTYGKVDFALNALENKVFDRHKKHMKNTRSQVYRLAAALYPYNNLQERSYNINYYISKYGVGIVDYIINSLNYIKTDHKLIHMSQYKG